MRFIPTTVHGLVDYLVGIVVIALPFLLGLGGAAQIVLIAIGVGVLLYSAMTDYELGVVRFLRIRFHLALDVVFGILMLLMPFFLDVSGTAHWPFYLLGILALAFALTTKVRADGTAAR